MRDNALAACCISWKLELVWPPITEGVASMRCPIAIGKTKIANHKASQRKNNEARVNTIVRAKWGCRVQGGSSKATVLCFR
mmetsp:Transcript_13183/g.27679  ORF Transcript_13183/g.27679 Transcript_13183/m.27679 type:complete len:81 (-) Transcript_13183:17-259(-)